MPNQYESEQILDFPTRGIDVTREFELQPPGTTVHGVNVRAYDTIRKRGRGGSRSGLSKYIEDQLPEGAVTIQHLNFIVHDDGSALLYTLLPEPGTPVTENPQIPGTYVPTGGSGVQPNANVTQHANDNPLPNWFLGTVAADLGGGSYSVGFAGGGPATTISVDGSPVIPVGAVALFIKRTGTYAVQPVNWLG